MTNGSCWSRPALTFSVTWEKDALLFFCHTISKRRCHFILCSYWNQRAEPSLWLKRLLSSLKVTQIFPSWHLDIKPVLGLFNLFQHVCLHINCLTVLSRAPLWKNSFIRVFPLICHLSVFVHLYILYTYALKSQSHTRTRTNLPTAKVRGLQYRWAYLIRLGEVMQIGSLQLNQIHA